MAPRVTGERREVRGYEAVRAAARDFATYSSDLIGDRHARDYRQLPLEADPPRHTALRKALQSSGVLDGNQLQAAGTAATVRTDGGQAQVTKGPAVEAGNELYGYYIYDAPDLDAATAFAARIPVARLGGTVEVRPMLER